MKPWHSKCFWGTALYRGNSRKVQQGVNHDFGQIGSLLCSEIQSPNVTNFCWCTRTAKCVKAVTGFSTTICSVYGAAGLTRGISLSLDLSGRALFWSSQNQRSPCPPAVLGQLLAFMVFSARRSLVREAMPRRSQKHELVLTEFKDILGIFAKRGTSVFFLLPTLDYYGPVYSLLAGWYVSWSQHRSTLGLYDPIVTYLYYRICYT